MYSNAHHFELCIVSVPNLQNIHTSFITQAKLNVYILMSMCIRYNLYVSFILLTYIRAGGCRITRNNREITGSLPMYNLAPTISQIPTRTVNYVWHTCKCCVRPNYCLHNYKLIHK